MSYDPYSSYPDQPQPGVPYGEYTHQPPSEAERLRGRVQAPAITLIVVAILNLLMVLVQGGGTVRLAFQTPEEIEKEQMLGMKFFPKEVQDEVEKEKAQKDPQAEKVQSLVVNSLVSLVMLLGALLTLVGGIRMLSFRSYGLAVAGAISAAVPCISCSGCCGFGEIIGIWALVVLLNSEVKAAFH